MTKALIVYITASSRKEADELSRMLVEEKLAACVTVLPKAISRYRWKGKIERSEEHLLIAKTRPQRYKALEKRVLELHSYDVPEILAVPIVKGSKAYLRWIQKTC